MKKDKANKSDIVREVAKRLGISQADARANIDAFLSAIKTNLGRGKIEIRGFGVFRPAVYPARMQRTPQTGEEFLSPAHAVATFRASSEVTRFLTQGKSHGA